MIQLKNIYKSLGGHEILKGVSMQINTGENFVIVGSSGTGKSVTLKHIMGLFTPDRGDVIIKGKNIAHLSRKELEEIRTSTGVLFQNGALISWLNIEENLALPLYEKTKLGDAEIKSMVKDALAMVELSGIEKKMPSNISGGMKKRAGLARGIIRNPDIILYDEPTSGLDPVLARKIDNLILHLQEKLNVTSVIVTHDLHSAFTIADKILMLHEGKVVQQGTPEEFMKSSHPHVKAFIEAQPIPLKFLKSTEEKRRKRQKNY
ncbi:MAG: ABC transporter ATP-binding protein [Verrucomicrobiota bacterium]|nr:ABC transporter ATP-binding protein [Verrucomicrobiota bacterium]